MKLIKDYTEDSAFTFLGNKKYEEVEKLIEDYGCDAELINTELLKKYHKDKYFVLVDYIDDNNNGYFHIRIWKFWFWLLCDECKDKIKKIRVIKEL